MVLLNGVGDLKIDESGKIARHRRRSRRQISFSLNFGDHAFKYRDLQWVPGLPVRIALVLKKHTALSTRLDLPSTIVEFRCSRINELRFFFFHSIQYTTVADKSRNTHVQCLVIQYTIIYYALEEPNMLSNINYYTVTRKPDLVRRYTVNSRVLFFFLFVFNRITIRASRSRLNTFHICFLLFVFTREYYRTFFFSSSSAFTGFPGRRPFRPTAAATTHRLRSS